MPVPRRSETPRPQSIAWLAAPALAAFRAAGTDAHRLASHREAWLERFGEDALLSYQSEAARDALLADLPAWLEQNALPLRRIFGKFIPRQNEERIAPALLSGDAALPLATVVSENGLRYGLDFAAGYSAGLFIDQRANRALLRRAGVQRLLNTFAYTCSFSVAAAAAGARTVSVDLSKKSLDRGRENFALNALDPAPHTFLADDALDVLPRLARRQEKFDAIILDPPTFSRGNKGRRFQVEQDLESLLVAALEVAGPRARILISTNCARLDKVALERLVRFALKLTQRTGDLHREPDLPDVPAEFAARALWLTLR
jgi:23S rRNA (cytosine1962-C5)-methyltransferase